MSKHFHYILPVWGEAYVKTFTDICLPMLLGYSGLGETVSAKDKFIIATTWHDRCNIMASQAYQELCQLMPVEFKLIDGFVDLKNSYQAMSYCYHLAMRDKELVRGETYYVSLTPDSFWSEGTFARLRELREEGYKAAMAIGVRLALEPLRPIYTEAIKNRKDSRIELPYSELVRHLIEHIHPMAATSNLLSRDDFNNQWPSNICWINTEEQQFIAHCFHLHPLMLKAPYRDIPIEDTIDGKFLNRLGYAASDFYVFKERYFACELTTLKRQWDVKLKAPSINKIVNFACTHATDIHMYYFEHRLVLGETTKVNPELDRIIKNLVERVSAGRKSRIKVAICRIKQVFKQLAKSVLNKLMLVIKEIMRYISAKRQQTRVE